MADLRLKIAVFPHGQWDGLRDGRAKPEGIALEHVQASPNTYRRMVRNLEFDIAEVALTTFVAAKWFGVPITGIPIFSNRDVTMSPISYNVRSGIEAPKDLEGKWVGLRSYTVTNTTQCRALLNSEFGVDTNSIQYSVSEDAHVAQYVLTLHRHTERLTCARATLHECRVMSPDGAIHLDNVVVYSRRDGSRRCSAS